MAKDGLILTEAQLMSMKRKEGKSQESGEIETEHSGSLVLTYFLRRQYPL